MESASLAHLPIVEYLFAEKPFETLVYCTRHAADLGHLETMKFLLANDPAEMVDQNVALEAVLGGQLEVLKWLRAHGKFYFYPELAFQAAAMGYLEILKFLLLPTSDDQTDPAGWYDGYNDAGIDCLHYCSKEVDLGDLVPAAVWGGEHNEYRAHKNPLLVLKWLVEKCEATWDPAGLAQEDEFEYREEDMREYVLQFTEKCDRCDEIINDAHWYTYSGPLYDDDGHDCKAEATPQKYPCAVCGREGSGDVMKKCGRTSL